MSKAIKLRDAIISSNNSGSGEEYVYLYDSVDVRTYLSSSADSDKIGVMVNYINYGASINVSIVGNKTLRALPSALDNSGAYHIFIQNMNSSSGTWVNWKPANDSSLTLENLKIRYSRTSYGGGTGTGYLIHSTADNFTLNVINTTIFLTYNSNDFVIRMSGSNNTLNSEYLIIRGESSSIYATSPLLISGAGCSFKGNMLIDLENYACASGITIGSSSSFIGEIYFYCSHPSTAGSNYLVSCQTSSPLKGKFYGYTNRHKYPVLAQNTIMDNWEAYIFTDNYTISTMNIRNLKLQGESNMKIISDKVEVEGPELYIYETNPHLDSYIYKDSSVYLKDESDLYYKYTPTEEYRVVDTSKPAPSGSIAYYSMVLPEEYKIGEAIDVSDFKTSMSFKSRQMLNIGFSHIDKFEFAPSSQIKLPFAGLKSNTFSAICSLDSAQSQDNIVIMSCEDGSGLTYNITANTFTVNYLGQSTTVDASTLAFAYDYTGVYTYTLGREFKITPFQAEAPTIIHTFNEPSESFEDSKSVYVLSSNTKAKLYEARVDNNNVVGEAALGINIERYVPALNELGEFVMNGIVKHVRVSPTGDFTIINL